jgi:hypothetical protein
MSVWQRGAGAVFSRLAGAVTRALLVMFVIATPTVLLADARVDSQQMVSLVALFIGVLTFVEYSSVYPGLVEFRDAPPFNRIRFLMLFFTVFCLSAIERGRIYPSTLTDLIHAVGALVGFSMDFPYSPVRMATRMLADNATEAQIGAVRTAAGMSYIISLMSLAFFVIMLRLGGWPRRDRPFNVWVNLPTFDPTSGGDVVARLNRDARWNIGIGFLLPFVTPSMVKLVSVGFEAVGPTSPQTLVWALTLWSFLPASLFMRGIAMGRVADMILARRLASTSPEATAQYAPV